MIGVSALFAVFALDEVIARPEAALLAALLVAYVAYLVWQARAEPVAASAPRASGPSGWDAQRIYRSACSREHADFLNRTATGSLLTNHDSRLSLKEVPGG